MVIHKELTIKELLNEMKVIKSRLIKLSDKYNRSLINVSAITWKDIVTSGGKREDIMLNRVIKQESLQNEFDIVLESYNDYKEEAIDKIKEMIATKPVDECIVYFRDVLNWKWKPICSLFSYSRSRASKLYSDYKKNNK